MSYINVLGRGRFGETIANVIPNKCLIPQPHWKKFIERNKNNAFYKSYYNEIALGVQNNFERKKVYESCIEHLGEIKIRFPNIRMEPTACLGKAYMGAIFYPYVWCGDNVKIGIFPIIEKGVTISHDCTIGDFVYIGADSYIGDGCIIEDGVYIQPKTIITGNVKIGKNTLIGLNSYVDSSVPDHVFANGRPLSIIRSNIPDGKSLIIEEF